MRQCILVVRPEAQAHGLLEYCQRQGWHAMLFATLDIQAIDHKSEEVQSRLNASDVAFWVSANAIMAAARLRVQPPLYNVCVGQATLRCFHQFFPQVFACAPNVGLDSEAVLKLPLWQDPSLRQVVVLNGENGRDWLTKQLLALGKSVQTISLYQRVQKQLDWERFRQVTQEYDGLVCVYSKEAVQNLFEQAPYDLREKLQSLLYLTIHERIAQTLHQYGAHRVVVGQDGHVSVLKLLHEHVV